MRNKKRYGWICPRCQKVHAPDVKECDCEPEQITLPALPPLPQIPAPWYPFPYPIPPERPWWQPPYKITNQQWYETRTSDRTNQ